MNDFAIEVKGLTKQFNHHIAVDHVSLSVKRGAIFGFLGANGSGKTTTLRMLSGLLTPSSGEGTCLGFNILTQSEKLKKILAICHKNLAFIRV